MAKLTELPDHPTKPSKSLRDFISLYFGAPGVGKTTFVNSFGNVLFLSTDRGTRFIKAMRRECGTWEDFDYWLTKLEKKKNHGYDFICVDHVADWADMAETHVLESLGITALADAGYGKGWSIYKKTLGRFMQRIKRLKCGLVFLAHEEIKTVKVQGIDVDKVMPAMSKQAWGQIIPVCDLVGYIGMKPVKKGGKRVEIRTIQTEPKQDLYAKDRTNRPKPVKDWEPLDGPAFLKSFSTQSE